MSYVLSGCCTWVAFIIPSCYNYTLVSGGCSRFAASSNSNWLHAYFNLIDFHKSGILKLFYQDNQFPFLLIAHPTRIQEFYLAAIPPGTTTEQSINILCRMLPMTLVSATTIFFLHYHCTVWNSQKPLCNFLRLTLLSTPYLVTAVTHKITSVQF